MERARETLRRKRKLLVQASSPKKPGAPPRFGSWPAHSFWSVQAFRAAWCIWQLCLATTESKLKQPHLAVRSSLVTYSTVSLLHVLQLFALPVPPLESACSGSAARRWRSRVHSWWASDSAQKWISSLTSRDGILGCARSARST